MTNTYTGFFRNRASMKGKEIWTAREGKFYEGHTSMRTSELVEGVEGNSLVLDENLKALLPYKEELKAGKSVDVYVEWELNDDHSDYVRAETLKVEVNEKTAD